MRKPVVLFFIGMCLASVSFAQTVTPTNFEQLKKRLNTPSDTTVVYNFWATWCVPCIKELPEFEKFYADYAGKKVKLVLVSLNFTREKAKVEEFAARHNLKAELLLLTDEDYNAWIDKVSPKWEGSIPATCVVSGPKAERQFHEGPLTYAELEQFVKPLIKQ